MARPLSPLTLTTEQRELLETINRCREVPHNLIQRVRIVLSANAGCNNKTISQDTGLCEDTVGFWRKRWLEGCVVLEKLADKPKLLREAVSQLLADKPRPGSPGIFTAEQICRLTVKPSTRLLVLNIPSAGTDVPAIGKKSKQSTLIQTRSKQKNATKEMIIRKTNQSEI